MPDFEFEGHYHKPERGEVIRCLMLIDYLHYVHAVAYTKYLESDPEKISRATINNAKREGTMSAEVFASLTRQLFREFTKLKGDGSFARLSEMQSDVKVVVLKMFPVLKEHLHLEARQTESLFLPYASPRNAIMDEILEKFEHGAFIYRYARNRSKEDQETPRLAKGLMQVERAESDTYLNFTIRYHVDSENDLNGPFDIVIRGRLMLIKAFLYFVGVEDDFHYPFFMVMQAKLQGQRFKAMIMRKHPRVSYFSSRVMIVAATEAGSAPQTSTGKFTIQELPELDEKHLFHLLNATPNEGRSVLLLDD
jgi:hypothetical protein